MGSTRIYGRKIAFQLDAEDYWADATSVVLDREDADSDVVTFEDAASGNTQQEFLQITAIQSTDPTSLWRKIWDESGQEVPFTFAPHGNETPTAAQPHFVGTCTVPARPALGGEAGRTTVQTFEARFDLVGKATMDDGTTGG